MEAFETLRPQDFTKLRNSSGISDEIIRARGYRHVYSRVDKDNYSARGFEKFVSRFPALEIPVYGPDGKSSVVQLRPDIPRVVDGKPIKYEWLPGEPLRLDVHPLLIDRVKGTEPLYITEGILKADSAVSRGLCCIGLMGVTGYKGKNSQGGTTAFAEWDLINLKDRLVYIVFDSDIVEKLGVMKALVALESFLKAKQANPVRITLPGGPDGEKVGLDDFFVQGGNVEKLRALAVVPPTEAAIEPIVEQLNRKYALLTQAHYYVEEGTDQFGQATFVAHTLSELRNIHANKLVERGGGLVNPIDLWNKHPKRREYKFMDLLPGKPQSECGNVLNMWRGWHVQPKAGACDLILAHIRTRIANGDEAICGKVLDLLAFHVQNPLEKIRIALVLRSKTGGTGKGLLGEYLQKIYGPHFVRAESKRAVVGQFNAHLAQALMIFVDEATFGGDIQSANVLKTLISEPTRDLEHKGKDVVRVRNLAMLIIAGNASHLVHVEAGDRRHFVLDVKEQKMPIAESTALVAEMNGEGAGAFLRFLMDRELPEAYNHHDVPETAARTEAKMLSMPPLERFTHGFLHDGKVSLKTDDGELRDLLWPVDEDFLKQDEWYSAFQQWCSKNRVHFAPDKPTFFRELAVGPRSLGLSLRRTRPGGRGQQFGASIVPPLDDARSIFAKACNLGDAAWDGATTVEEQRETIDAIRGEDDDA
jgi:hypothetical protein